MCIYIYMYMYTHIHTHTHIIKVTIPKPFTAEKVNRLQRELYGFLMGHVTESSVCEFMPGQAAPQARKA